MSVQYTAIFHGCKNDNFQMKIFDSFSYFCSKHRLCVAKIRKNVYPCKSQFYYIKVGCKGVFVTRTCFRDVRDKMRMNYNNSLAFIFS